MSALLAAVHWNSLPAQHFCEVNVFAKDLRFAGLPVCRVDTSHRAQQAFCHLRDSNFTLGEARLFFALRAQLPSRLIREFSQQRWEGPLPKRNDPTSC